MNGNVGGAERWVSAAAGVAALGIVAVGRRPVRLALLPIGVQLVRRAISGQCEVKRALVEARAARVTRGPRPDAPGRRVEHAVTIARPPAELYRFWRRLDNLPRFMDNLESVTEETGGRWRWTAKGPLGTRVSWVTEVHEELPDELIAWRSVAGEDVMQHGAVYFTPAVSGGTDVRLVLRYAQPEAGSAALLAEVLGEDPDGQIADDFRRLKQVMDGGEVGAPPLAGPAL
jgi:uncharacterized membrane protein